METELGKRSPDIFTFPPPPLILSKKKIKKKLKKKRIAKGTKAGRASDKKSGPL